LYSIGVPAPQIVTDDKVRHPTDFSHAKAELAVIVYINRMKTNGVKKQWEKHKRLSLRFSSSE
jgi:hypothetical protein